MNFGFSQTILKKTICKSKQNELLFNLQTTILTAQKRNTNTFLLYDVVQKCNETTIFFFLALEIIKTEQLK